MADRRREPTPGASGTSEGRVLRAIDSNIARCRLFLSVTTVFCIYVDPGKPFLSHWVPLISGAFVIDPRLWTLMAVHLAYSAIVYLSIQRQWVLPYRLSSQPLWVDLLFATAIAALTQGTTSPAFPFVAFTAMTGGLRAGLRRAMLIGVVSVVLYIGLVSVQRHAGPEVYIMRLVYLGLTGYVLFSLGQQYLDLQEHARQLEAAEERLRIARELHDGHMQTLAGTDLWLESSRRLLQANAVDRALARIAELQAGVRREYDALRAFARSLTAVESQPTAREEDGGSGSVDLLAQILTILREGIFDFRRHPENPADVVAGDLDVATDAEADPPGFEGAETSLSTSPAVAASGGEMQTVTDLLSRSETPMRRGEGLPACSAPRGRFAPRRSGVVRSRGRC